MPTDLMPKRAWLMFAAVIVGLVEYAHIGEYCPQLVAHLRSQLRMPPLITAGPREFEMADVSGALPIMGQILVLSNGVNVRIVSEVVCSDADMCLSRRYEGLLVGTETSVSVECKAHDKAGLLRQKREVLQVASGLHSPSGFPKYIGELVSPNCIVTEFVGSDFLGSMRGIAIRVDITGLVPALIKGLAALHAANYLYSDLLPKDLVLLGDHSDSLRMVFSPADLDRLPRGKETYANPLPRATSSSNYFSALAEQRDEPLSPADDIERLMYVLIDLFYVDLPWQVHTMYSAWLLFDDVSDNSAATGYLQDGIIIEKCSLRTDSRFFDRYQIPQAFRLTLEYLGALRTEIDYERIIRFFS